MTAKNVLVVTLDDAAQADTDELRAAGWMPTYDSLVAQGIEYRQAYCSPQCSPSRRGIFFSKFYFSESGVGCDPLPGFEPPLSLTSIANVAATALVPNRALFGKWHLGGDPTDPTGATFLTAPLVHGFTHWQGTPGNMTSCGGSGYANWKYANAGSYGPSTAYSPLEIEQQLAAYIAAHAGEQMFIKWSMNLPHAPFHTVPTSCRPPGYPAITITDRDRFKMMLATCDYQLGRVLTKLDLADWLVIVIGDNGTPESISPDPARAKNSTFERGVRIPLVMAGAGLIPSTSEKLVSGVDILPTLADYWSVSPPSGIDGISLVGGTHGYVLVGQAGGWFGGNPAVPGDWAAIGNFTGGQRWKLRRFGLPNQALTEELYDLVNDPDELVPLAPNTHFAISLYLRNHLIAAGAP